MLAGDLWEDRQPNSHFTYCICRISHFELEHDTSGLREPFQKTKITLAGDTVSQHSVCLTGEMADAVILPRVRGDGWLEAKLGEFCSGDGIDGEVSISLTETEGGDWKNGLIVKGIEVRPKH